MPKMLAAATILLMMGLVISRVIIMKRRGIEAVKFGLLDKTDFLIPPFMLFYFYTVFAAGFGWPLISREELLPYAVVAWSGVACCLAGLALLTWAILSFGRAFRIGIDVQKPDALITEGAFATSRNPIYVAFAIILAGQFLIFSNWVTLIYFAAALWLFHRQVLREEGFLKTHYGEAYAEYCRRVRRYL